MNKIIIDPYKNELSVANEGEVMARKEKEVVGSPRFSMSKKEAESVLRGALVAMVGAGLTYIIQYLGQFDFGEYQVLVAAVLAISTNLVRKYLMDTRV